MKIKLSIRCGKCNSEAHNLVLDTDHLPVARGNVTKQLEIFNIESDASQSINAQDATSYEKCKVCGNIAHPGLHCSGNPL